jgi:membrane fusion protein (multidrug efflux system)
VRIYLDAQELQAHPLRIGLSMQVDVNVADDSGTQLGAATPTAYSTDVFDQYGAQAESEIARVIAQNTPAPQALARR